MHSRTARWPLKATSGCSASLHGRAEGGRSEYKNPLNSCDTIPKHKTYEPHSHNQNAHPFPHPPPPPHHPNNPRLVETNPNAHLANHPLPNYPHLPSPFFLKLLHHRLRPLRQPRFNLVPLQIPLNQNNLLLLYPIRRLAPRRLKFYFPTLKPRK